MGTPNYVCVGEAPTRQGMDGAVDGEGVGGRAGASAGTSATTFSTKASSTAEGTATCGGSPLAFCNSSPFAKGGDGREGGRGPPTAALVSNVLPCQGGDVGAAVWPSDLLRLLLEGRDAVSEPPQNFDAEKGHGDPETLRLMP